MKTAKPVTYLAHRLGHLLALGWLVGGGFGCVSTPASNGDPTATPSTDAQTPDTGGGTGSSTGGETPTNVLLVSGYNSDTVHRIDLDDRVSLGDLGTIPGAQSITVGPDGARYVVAEKVNQIVRIADATATPFVSDDPATADDELGGLTNPTAAVFGPDGLLYVGGFGSDSVHRFDGVTGAFVDVFADASDGLDGPDAGMVFDAAGNLYVPCFEGNNIVVFDVSGTAVRTISEGLKRPRTIHVRDDGELWVTAWGAGKVMRFAADGSPLPDLASTSAPSGLLVDGDTAYVTTDQTSKVFAIDVATGAVNELFDGRKLGIDGATFLAWENH